jgi:predicted GH43/DUF377 family glycosyl hydrolase
VIASELVTRHAAGFDPDPTRVITKLFVPGEENPETRSRAGAVLSRVLALDDATVAALVASVLADFAGRHKDLVAVLEHNASLMSRRLVGADELSRHRRLLVGAFFTHEYAVEAAALCNPSLVEHPSQDGLEPGQRRVVLSLRGVGEGHLSSIGFATGVLGAGPTVRWDRRTGPVTAAEHQPDWWSRDWLRAALTHDGCDNEITATVLATLPEPFGRTDLDRALAGLDHQLSDRSGGGATLRRIRELAAASYTVRFSPDTDLSQRVLWPTGAAESNGMEDARFVRFTGADGVARYLATYTAYDGHTVAPHLLESDDLSTFRSFALTGPAARNKGMALFPRLVDGRHLALCRGDGESSGLTSSTDGRTWAGEVPLHVPSAPWELLQVGNCGSPMETADGWLVLTHGVGPMRTYAMGAMLLDLADPTRVLAVLPEPLLAPDGNDRDGYVPNVVYSCGGLIHDGTLWLPYGRNDNRVTLASVPVSALMDRFEPRRR